MAQSDKAFGGLPTVRVGIGMSIEQLKAGSTYPFTRASSVQLAGDFQAFQITTPYNLVFVDGDLELRLENLGGQRELTNITVKQGRVTDMTVTVQTSRTNLRQTLEQAKGLRQWFAQHGYQQDSRPNFVVQSRMSKHAIEPITSFEQAEAAFLDPSIKLAEMGLFGFKKGDVSVGVSLANGRRMLAKHGGKEHGDESGAKEEKRYGLSMFIAEAVKPYKHSPTGAGIAP
jgi:hypothetical protein